MLIRTLLLVTLVLLSSCAREADEERRVPAFSVSVVEAQRRDLSGMAHFIGTLRAQEEVEVYPRVGGKIYERKVRKGDEVARGQVMFTIDRDVVGYQFEKARVESPISGRVSMVYVDPGSRVDPQSPVALVQNDAVVKARIWVGERDYPHITEGLAAYLAVGAYRGEEFPGKVEEVSPFFDARTHTALVDVAFDNPDGKLKPGMFAEIRVETQRRSDAVTIPFDALLRGAEGAYVYVVEDDHAYRRDVTTGLRSGEFLEIRSGLDEGEKVVYRGKEFLEEGMKVRTVTE